VFLDLAHAARVRGRLIVRGFGATMNPSKGQYIPSKRTTTSLVLLVPLVVGPPYFPRPTFSQFSPLVLTPANWSGDFPFMYQYGFEGFVNL